MPVTYASTIEIEAAWLSVLGPPTGPFAGVLTSPAHVSDPRSHLYLGVTRLGDARVAKDGWRQEDTEVTALVAWAARDSTPTSGPAHLDQRAMDDAIAAVVDRVTDDATHGGAWAWVSEVVVEPPPPATLYAMADAVAASGGAYLSSLRWTVTRWHQEA